MTEEPEEFTETSRAQRVTAIVLVAFTFALFGAVTFAVVYALGEDGQLATIHTQVLGTSLAVALGGLGVGLVAWAKHLMPQGPHVEERELMGSSQRERAQFINQVKQENAQIGRRKLLSRFFGLVAGVTGIAALFPIRSLTDGPFPERRRTAWRAGIRLVTEEGEPVRVTDLEFGSIITVYPEGFERRADNQTVLLRVPPDILKARPGREDWMPAGYVAYSKVCTHAGCPVGLYQTHTQRLVCPCHQSAFDVLDGARPVFGPVTRSLPQLPLGTDSEDYLVARGDYDVPIGPGYWSWPS